MPPWGESVTADEFAHGLRLGLGRVIVWLRAHPSSEFRDLILHACTHNLAFDRQVDGSREDYLFDLVQASSEPDYYYGRLMEALLGPNDEALYPEQMFRLLRLWAAHGHPTARRDMYSAFETGCIVGDDAGADAIITLDHADGLIFVAEWLGKLKRDYILDYYGDARVLDYAKDIGLAAPLEILWQATHAHPAIGVFLERVANYELHEERTQKGPTRDPVTVSYTELREALDNIATKRLPVPAKAWGEFASEADLRHVAQDLLTESHPERLRRMLQVFWKRAYPLGPEPLIALMQHPAERVPVIALGALEAMPPHPAVRALALRLLAGSDQMAARAVGVLEHQFQPGDHALVEALKDRLTDPEAWHSYNFDAVDFYVAHPDPAGEARVMLALYEHNPCNNCRKKMVDRLIALNALPDWMAAECRLDASLRIRKTMAAYDNAAAQAATAPR